MRQASFPTRDERKLAVRRLAGEARKAKGAGAEGQFEDCPSTGICHKVTGSLLALKKDFAALQPTTQSGSRPGDLQRPLAEIVAAALPAARATDWHDVERIGVRPGDGIAKVVFHSRTEVDLASAKVLQVGYRTSDFIETIHDFSVLGPYAKYVLSFGSGLAILGMASTGVYLFLLPMLARRKKRRAATLKRPS